MTGVIIMQAEISLCQQLERIMKGKSQLGEDVCTVRVDRKLQAQVLGKPCHFLSHAFNFELEKSVGPILITGEFVLAEHELAYVTSYLLSQNITVSAIHNHFIFDRPRLIYVHCQAVMEPLTFANRMAYLLQRIG